MKLQISQVFWINQMQADSWAGEANPKGLSNVWICTLQQFKFTAGRGRAKKRKQDGKTERDRVVFLPWLLAQDFWCRHSADLLQAVDNTSFYVFASGLPRTYTMAMPKPIRSYKAKQTLWICQDVLSSSTHILHYLEFHADTHL